MTYNQLVAHFGGLTKAAEALDLHKQTIHAWKRMGRIPTDRQLKLARITGLKPDRTARKEAEEIAAYVNGNA